MTAEMINTIYNKEKTGKLGLKPGNKFKFSNIKHYGVLAIKWHGKILTTHFKLK